MKDLIFLFLMLINGTKQQDGFKTFLGDCRNGKTPSIICKLLKIERGVRVSGICNRRLI